MVSINQMVLINNLFVLANSDDETNAYFICIINKSTGANILWRRFAGLDKLDAAAAIVLHSTDIFITVRTTDDSEMGVIRLVDIENADESNTLDYYFKIY